MKSIRRGALTCERLARAKAESSAARGLARLGPVGGLDDRHDLLAHLLVRRADHRHVGDLGMADQQVLDLLRIDVHAAGDDHEALAVGEEQIAVLVDPADVAERRPAVLVAALGGLFRIVVVFELGRRRRNRPRPRRAAAARRRPRRRSSARAIRARPTEPFFFSHSSELMAQKPLPSVPA
jgi:hypothetical protein